MPVKHKVFISYHHEDQDEVEQFIDDFGINGQVFIHRGLGLGMKDDIINSNDTDYVMRRIRELYLKDSTVTIVMIGKCTWARRYVDWEIQASLRSGDKVTPNGLMGIRLPSTEAKGPSAMFSMFQPPGPTIPQRLNWNLEITLFCDSYARVYPYPYSADQLAGWIDDAWVARTFRNYMIINPRERFKNNRTC